MPAQSEYCHARHIFEDIRGRHPNPARIRSIVGGLGCINYDLHCSIEDSKVYTFHENWASKKALDEHLEMSYLKEFLKKSDKLLEKPTELYLCTKI